MEENFVNILQRRRRKQLKKQEKRLNVISLKEKVNLAVVENKLLKVKVLSLEKDKELNNCIVHNLNVSDVSVGEIIGCGSFGVCREGCYGGHRVVVKQLKNKDLLKLEYRHMIKLCHPNIPILYGIVHETCSLVMSFHGSPSECSNLCNAVKNSFNQPFYPVYKGVFMGILRAVSYLQTKGILHNDIKPNNIAVQSMSNNNIVARCAY